MLHSHAPESGDIAFQLRGRTWSLHIWTRRLVTTRAFLTMRHILSSRTNWASKEEFLGNSRPAAMQTHFAPTQLKSRKKGKGAVRQWQKQIAMMHFFRNMLFSLHNPDGIKTRFNPKQRSHRQTSTESAPSSTPLVPNGHDFRSADRSLCYGKMRTNLFIGAEFSAVS